MKHTKFTLLAGMGAFALLVTANSLQAQTTLAGWTFQDTVVPSTVATNVTANNFAVSAGTISFQNGTSAANKIGFNSSWSQSATFDTSGKYWQFSLQAASGHQIAISEVLFGAGRTAAGPQKTTLQYSLDGFTTAGNTLLSGGDINSTAANNLDSFTITSSLPAVTTEAVTFRLWGYAASGTGNYRIDDVLVNGTVSSTTPPPANNNSVLSVAATTAFGRVMQDSNQTVAVSNLGDATTISASATGGFTPTATGSITADGTSNLSVGVGATLGSRSGDLTVNNTAADSAAAGQGSDQAPINTALSATVVQDRVLDVGAVAATTNGGIDLGRQMVGTVSGTHEVTSAGADAENTRVTFSDTASNTFGGYAASGLAEVRATNADGTDVVLDGSTSMNIAYEMDFTQTGARANDTQFIQFNTGNGISGEGLDGETVLSGQDSAGNLRVYIQNATIVDNREVAASAVDLGSVLVGTTTGSQNTTLTTTGDDDNFTRVTVEGSSVSTGGITIASGSDQLFDDASDSITRSITGNFATSGSQNVDVDFSVLGEGLANETVNAATVNAVANVYQAAALSVNNASTVGDAATLTVQNANTSDGGQRAGAEIVSRIVTGDGWDVTGLSTGTTIGQDGSASGTTSFDAAASGLLNGVTSAGSLMIGFQHADQSIQGTATNDLGTTTWNFEAVVSGNDSGSGEANLTSGDSFTNIGITRDGGSAASFLDGSASDSRLINMELGLNPVGLGVGSNPDAISDYLSLSGTGTDMFVLSMLYAGSPDTALIQWWDGGEWVNAVDGNSTGTANFLGDVAYDSGEHFSLGNYGFDSSTNTAWAVLDHNSEFVVAIPEPSHAVLLGLSMIGLLARRKRTA